MSPQRRQAARKGRRSLVTASAAALAGVLAIAAVATWMSHGAEPAATLPVSGPPPPAVDPTAAVAELLTLAPELTPASAEMVARAMPGASGPPLAEMGLLFASRGFESLDRAELLEVGQLFEEVYATLPPADRDWMGEYMRLLREGDLTPEASVRGRRLLTQGVSLVPPARRARLQALVEKSIRSALEARRRAQERTPPPPMAEAQFQPFAPLPPNSPPPEPAGIVPSASPGAAPVKDEAYWRARMKEARARVARLRQRVEAMQADVRHNAGSTSLAQRSRVEELARVRADLAAAELAIGEIEEEARKAGALPGWLRE